MSYSNDLRERVVAFRRQKGMTLSKTARVFRVGEATVKRWCKLARERGRGSVSKELNFCFYRLIIQEDKQRAQ